MTDVMKALEAAISENPDDVVPQMALADLLMENGKSPLAAKRRVVKVVREARWQRKAMAIATAKKRVEERSRRGARLRDRIRQVSNGGYPYALVNVVMGNSPPQSPVEGYYFHGSHVQRYRSWVTVNVGHEWVLNETAKWRM